MIKFIILSSFALLASFGGANADTPANCSYEDIRGIWVFHEGPRGQVKTVNCTASKS